MSNKRKNAKERYISKRKSKEEIFMILRGRGRWGGGARGGWIKYLEHIIYPWIRVKNPDLCQTLWNSSLRNSVCYTSRVSSGTPVIPVYRSYRHTVHTSIPFILVYRSYRYTVHTGIPFIPVYRSYRYTVHIGIPFIPVYRSYRHTVHVGIPFIPVYRSYWYTVHTGIPFIPVYRS